MPRLGQAARALVIAVDEGGPEVPFQFMDFPAEPGLLHSQPLGGAAEVKFFGHHYEALEFAVHKLGFLAEKSVSPIRAARMVAKLDSGNACRI